MKKSRLTISYLPGADVVVLSQDGEVFISTKDSIIIGKNTIVSIFSNLVRSGTLSKKILEGLLEELNTE